MSPGKPIDPDVVALTFNYYREEKFKKASVARRIKKSYSWVCDVLRDYDPETKERKVTKPRGRPRINTPEQDEDILSFVRADRELSGVKISAELGLDHRTLLRRLRENRVRRSKAISNGLTPSHMEIE
ncbi:hypothetical protein RvY_04465 [Ramazzottius varieornatus]|uniref:Uncharacterized protein n=1 Tax=Ramazzottius varieornatus TaxID=947166 RepID=A0A1D1URP3_RAMVA|nr:hypothetical protein RvY_04465 [Ramazzottius varieornatus]